MESNLRARTLFKTRGFLKCLVEADGDRFLGFAAFGTGAGEIMGAVQVAMIAGLPYTALRDAVLTHPTLVEDLITVARGMLRRCNRLGIDSRVDRNEECRNSSCITLNSVQTLLGRVE
ncbi:MAG: hypothetical protein ABSE51_14250 [Terracidiphilus sp.]|jgi:hypothetical protein